MVREINNFLLFAGGDVCRPEGRPLASHNLVESLVEDLTLLCIIHLGLLARKKEARLEDV